MKVQVTLEFGIGDAAPGFSGIEILDGDGFCVLREASTEEAIQALKDLISDAGFCPIEINAQLINVIGGDPA
jgi:hypothetical protein